MSREARSRSRIELEIAFDLLERMTPDDPMGSDSEHGTTECMYCGTFEREESLPAGWRMDLFGEVGTLAARDVYGHKRDCAWMLARLELHEETDYHIWLRPESWRCRTCKEAGHRGDDKHHEAHRAVEKAAFDAEEASFLAEHGRPREFMDLMYAHGRPLWQSLPVFTAPRGTIRFPSPFAHWHTLDTEDGKCSCGLQLDRHPFDGRWFLPHGVPTWTEEEL